MSAHQAKVLGESLLSCLSSSFYSRETEAMKGSVPPTPPVRHLTLATFPLGTKRHVPGQQQRREREDTILTCTNCGHLGQ